MKAPKGLILPKEKFSKQMQREMILFFSAVKKLPWKMLAPLIFFIFIFSFSSPGRVFEKVENMIHDMFAKHTRLPVDPSIVLIEISDDSLQAFGRWPWPRRYHAALTHALQKWEAKAIVFDLLFLEPSDPFDDQSFQEAAGEAPRVYFSTVAGSEITDEVLPGLVQNAKGVGHINIFPDSDGVIRRIRPVLEGKAESYPHLALKVAYDLLNLPDSDMAKLPRDGNGSFLIHWAGSWTSTFKHYSYADILKSYQQVESNQKPLIDPEELRNKICIIGMSAVGQGDIKPTPLEAAYPAMGVHANVINSVLTRRFLKTISPVHERYFLLFLGIASLLFFLPFKNRIFGIIFFSFMVFWFFLSFSFFSIGGIVMPVFRPMLLVAVLYVISALWALWVAQKERGYFFRLATRDGLTGLFVIRHFRSLLIRAIEEARLNEESLSVVIMDVDDFKKVNDTYGHQAGDMVLKGTAQIVLQCTRMKRVEKESDIVARYGGEEIIIFLHKSNLLDAAFKVAERIRLAVEQMSYSWEDKKISPTISLGVSALRPGDTVDSLIRRADEALYRAKKQGKNKVCIEEKTSGSVEAKAA